MLFFLHFQTRKTRKTTKVINIMPTINAAMVDLAESTEKSSEIIKHVR